MAKAIKKDDPGAWIVNPKDKGRKSIKNGNVYLNNGDYFEIELFNPLRKSVLAKIKLNGVRISSSGLILRPGERVYLDCFIDDKKKFVFKTYEVENSEQSLSAIENNGLLEVEFYQEQNIFGNITTNTSINWTNDWWYNTINNNVNYNKFDSNIVNYSSNVSSYLSDNFSLSNNTNNIETGRIEKGEKSNQKFEEVSMNFSPFAYSSLTIKILPESRKPVEVSEVRKTSKYVDLVSKLADLYKEGLLTEEEFINKQKELLSKI